MISHLSSDDAAVVRSEEVDVMLAIDSNYSDDFRQAQPAVVRLIVDGSRDEGRALSSA